MNELYNANNGMGKFYFDLTDPESVKLLQGFKAWQNGKADFKINKTFVEKIREKHDNALKENYNAAYNAGIDYVENDTIDEFFQSKIDDIDKKMDTIEQQRSDALKGAKKNPHDDEELRYVAYFDKELVKLTRQKIMLMVDRTHPNDLSFIRLKKIVVAQLRKDMTNKLNNVTEKMDNDLLRMVDGLDKSALGELKRYIQGKLDENYEKKYAGASPDIEVLEEDGMYDDIIVEGVKPVGPEQSGIHRR